MTADQKGRLTGGIIGLDGVHPTILGYGVLAQFVMNAMRLAGVTFEKGGAARDDTVEVDWERLISADLLVRKPPRALDEDLKLVGHLVSHLHLPEGAFGWIGQR